MYLTQGIVLKKQDKGENDKVAVFFTRDYGKIALVAKGIRKSGSKLASHIELFSLSEIGFVLGKAKSVLTSAEEVDAFSSIKNDPERSKAAGHIVELVLKYTLDEEPDEEIFNILRQAFFYLDEKEFTELELEYFLRYFEFRFLSILGYQPKEVDILHFFSGENKKMNKQTLAEIKQTLLRYFKNVFNEV
ncbi:DNA repair protein RecO [Candidatus Azambacteria bacterium]|nr:DNA repair protein RecO [Candidatus Azambacteria bacterium]